MTMAQYGTAQYRKSASLIGRIFYQRNDKDSRYFRTIRIAHNPFANKLVPQATDFVMGEPPAELEPLPPLLKQQLFRVWYE